MLVKCDGCGRVENMRRDLIAWRCRCGETNYRGRARGLGDHVAYFIRKSGLVRIKYAWQRWRQWRTGVRPRCGCSERQAYLNELAPRKRENKN